MSNFWAISCVIVVMAPLAALFIGITLDLIKSYEDERELNRLRQARRGDE